MKYFTSDPGKLMPAEMLINPSDTVLESANDQGGQQIGPAGASRTRWNKPRLFREKDSGRSLEAKLLALGTTSVLATMMPVAADAKIIAFENQSVDLLLTQSLDVDGDKIPDLLCFYSVTDNGNVLVSCLDINGEGLSVNSDICGPDEANDQQNGCQTDAGSAKYLQSRIKTSRDLNAWVRLKIDSSKSLAIAEAWAYEDCVGQPIEVGQTSGGCTETIGIDSSGNITWKTSNNGNETGFKVYRDGILIGTTAANVTSFHDSSWPLPCASKPVTYVYVVMAISSGGDYEVGRGEFKCPPPPSARLMVAIEGLGSVTTSPNTISCEASDCHADPEDPSFPKCNPKKCAAQFEEETKVTLTPHPAPGYIFGSWGNHVDCKDGQVIMRPNDNKHCIAFFDKESSPTVRTSPSRTPTLPSLGECMAFDSHGNKIDATAKFEGGVLVNGKDGYQRVVTVTSADTVEILGKIGVDSHHLSLPAEIFVLATHQATEQDKPLNLMMDTQGVLLPWDGKDLTKLVPFRKEVLAADEPPVTIYQGKMLTRGIMKIKFGYRLEDGRIICGCEQPIEMVVK